MTPTWPTTSFYHLYPLGTLGAPARNDLQAPETNRLAALHDWLDYLQELGIGAVYLGPIFESSAHGYDTADYFKIDRRLGNNAAFAAWSAALHQRGLRLVLDAVFHHVGRDFWAFEDVQHHGQASAYCDWFHLDFARSSPAGDPFWYEGWAGHYDLVKLNLTNPEVRKHLLDAVKFWIDEFQIDGLRLDAADVLDLQFQQELAAFCRAIKPDFWLLGEVVHGDYRHWVNPQTLDSVTNYEVYKGLYSSHNDQNYFELAYSLERQFGEGGLYFGLPLYNFADNHDQPRIASRLTNAAHLYPLHILLLTMPGIPSIYYGSEAGISGVKAHDSDAPLRPALTPNELRARAHPLTATLHQLLALRANSLALRQGRYSQLQVAHQQFAFLREAGSEKVIVAVNSADGPASLTLPADGEWQDLLNGGQTFTAVGGQLQLPLDSCWGRILRQVTE